MKSLKAAQNAFASPLVQLQTLAHSPANLPRFEDRLKEVDLYPLRPTGCEVLQVNLGKMCNQTCAHCHVDAGPDRDEIMTRETMQDCLEALRKSSIGTVDLTGGAPEMNPNFRWFVRQISELGRRIIVRSNLTILTVNEKYRQLPEFFARHQVSLISSLPCYTAENTDRQRGNGVFERSIEALQMLNAKGFGKAGSGLELYLVYNPLGAFLPPPQAKLEADYRRILWEQHQIEFTGLYCITNMPISRFLDQLQQGGKYDEYMERLVTAFNPHAAGKVMCRKTLSVGWNGILYDCDFNQMLELGIEDGAPTHIRFFDEPTLEQRRIVLNQHCYGCTAGAGSSCTGEID